MANSDAADETAFLCGGGAMGRLIAQHDWASTALGPLKAWPPSLKTATAMILDSALPMALLLGEDGVVICNDAYAAMVGGGHRELLGARLREVCPEMADGYSQMLRSERGD